MLKLMLTKQDFLCCAASQSDAMFGKTLLSSISLTWILPINGALEVTTSPIVDVTVWSKYCH